MMRETIISRRSVRNYSDKPIPREILEEIFDMVRYAPSGMNRQSVNWTVIQDPVEVQRIAELTILWARDICSCGQKHPLAPIMPMLIGMWDQGTDLICHGAPHLVIVHGEKDDPSGYLDAIIAMTHLDLAASAHGLGTCWAGVVQIAADSSPHLLEELGLPCGHRSYYAMMLGYPKYRVQRVPPRNAAKVIWR
ncbi:nitroreductase family protein [Methanolobus sp. WCC5]|uniref:nitroreductase family protein n=1 Tax=Methanolobus sp. WCC5 TaxID=3125785 RepID=UPI00324C068A